MIERYKVVLSNKNFYKEIEISNDMQTVRIGTSLDCDVRLRRDFFFENFELTFSFASRWSVMCSDNVYIGTGSVQKLITKSLSHGDVFSIKYQRSGNELFNVEFVIDFDYEEKKYDLVIDIRNKDMLHIGGNLSCNVYVEDPYIAKEYISIVKNNNEYYILDKSTTYGVRVNGIRINAKQKLNDNDFISFASFSICIKDGFIFCDSSKVKALNDVRNKLIDVKKNRFKYPKFNRNTRLKAVVPDEKIEILSPPDAPNRPKENIVLQLLPAVIMLAVTVVFRGMMSNSNGSFVWISAISMSIGVITSVVGIVSKRIEYRDDVNERIDIYCDYIEEKINFVKECRQDEENILNDNYYSLQVEKQLVEDFSDQLFDRNITDADFLELRLGLGDKEAIRKVSFEKRETISCNDELQNKPEEIFESFKNVKNVPITVDLKTHNAIGIVGERVCLYEFLKIMTVDLVVRQYYTDVNLFYILKEDDEKTFEWLRLLPHIKNDALNMRNIVYNTDSKNALFEYLYKEMSRRESEEKDENTIFSQIVVFVYRDFGIKSHPISRFIETAASVGVTFIFLDENKEMLPLGCNSLVALNENEGMLFDAENKNNKTRFVYETISDGDIKYLVNKLAPIYCEEVSLEGSLTKNITLFGLLNIFNVEDINLKKNWEESQIYKSMAAPLGVKAGNEVVCLDLNEKHHGPHGLVAGTTGSGKSEILQSYILSMATIFHPYEVGFVIIDFKGGGMVNQFKNLPHLIGSITNIDGREINRSLLSIKAELRKRQEVFAQYDVNHIDAYIKLFKKGIAKTPLPHLILIVDEFAELKMDQPEFMKELISAARIGRSLGVHLILATQKPSGVVDAQIWSNSKFKLCLKVQNKEDSKEVLKTPVAAEIKEPGRAYLQVGNNEIFELFQSAYSGAPANTDESANIKPFTIYSLDLSGRHTPIYTRTPKKSSAETETQLVAITEYIHRYCEEQNIHRLPGICLPSLSELINYKEEALDVDNDIDVLVDIGIYDDPNNQYQGKVSYNLSSGNTLIVGSSQYGKTNMLQLMIRSIATTYSPSEVNMYILDFASMALNVFKDLNHIGGFISASDDEKLKNFMRMIKKEMKVRKEKFSSMGITSFSSYKEAGNNDMPQIIVMLDNFIAFKELFMNYAEELLNICREGIAVGVSVVMTSPQTNGISYKYMSNYSNRICLYCNSKDEYGSLFDRCRMTPKNVPGRCLIELDKTVFEAQSYLAFEGEKEIDRVEKIKEFIARINVRYANQKARMIPEVPKVLDKEFVTNNYTNNENYIMPIGVDYNSVDFVELNLIKTVTLGITGKKHFGKTNFVKCILEYLQKNIFVFESMVYIFDNYEKQLSDMSSMGIVEKYILDITEFEVVLEETEEKLQRRMEKVKEMGIESLEDEPLITFVIQNNDVFAATGMSKKAVDTYLRILKTYKNLKILFIFSDIENVAVGFGVSEMMKQIKELNTLVAMEDLMTLKLRDFPNNVIRGYQKPLELGDAYIIKGTELSKAKIIHAD